MEHVVLGVMGASGGLGVSTVAVALAVRAARFVGATVCVDRPYGGGLDVTACLEHLPGLRWGDLARSRGEVDGAGVLTALPAHRSTRVLAARGQRPPDEVVEATLTALTQVCGLTVLDLGTEVALPARCTDVVLLSGVSARQLADASSVTEVLQAAGFPSGVRLVLRMARRDGLSPEQVAAHLDLPLAATLRDDAQTLSDADHGRTPGTRSAGAMASVVDRLLLACGVGGPGLASAEAP
ncbi:hypothetical protein [Pedococcus sp. 5OH_020]|uniref:hypothetical protein n=1 Tax=Pedococcus sp. 5OH_020 TaxID=2989814 RepID=UPI0022EA06B9|nr:hypothetical protein [Pedococcus sp. 5OH_020]